MPIQAKMRLPGPFTNLVKTDKDQVLQFYIVKTSTYFEANGSGIFVIENFALSVLGEC
jgi:hypothetical protein